MNHATPIIPYTHRFREALSFLCVKAPPLDMCVAWLESDNERLQEWVLEHMKNDWATGIGTIDTARFMAEQVEEGRVELVSHGVERLLRRLQSGPLPVEKHRNGSWFSPTQLPDVSSASIDAAMGDDLVVLFDVVGKKAMLRAANDYTIS